MYVGREVIAYNCLMHMKINYANEGAESDGCKRKIVILYVGREVIAYSCLMHMKINYANEGVESDGCKRKIVCVALFC